MSATITDEQSAARDLVRQWAARGRGVRRRARYRAGPARCVATALPRAGRSGTVRRSRPEAAGGAGGSLGDLCAMVAEAARALIPGPVAALPWPPSL